LRAALDDDDANSLCVYYVKRETRGGALSY
jgi:hypothetical protein